MLYAKEAHSGQMRMTGEPYITHCIHTAKILAALVPENGTQVWLNLMYDHNSYDTSKYLIYAGDYNGSLIDQTYNIIERNSGRPSHSYS